MMKKLLFILFILAGCAKEPIEVQQRMVQLSVEGNGTYQVTYGTSSQVTVKGEDKWTAMLNINPGDTIQLTVRTAETPATLYLGVEVQDGLLYCRSLYVEPQSAGSLNYIAEP
jgi:hypothetical protein